MSDRRTWRSFHEKNITNYTRCKGYVCRWLPRRQSDSGRRTALAKSHEKFSSLKMRAQTPTTMLSYLLRPLLAPFAGVPWAHGLGQPSVVSMRESLNMHFHECISTNVILWRRAMWTWKGEFERSLACRSCTFGRENTGSAANQHKMNYSYNFHLVCLANILWCFLTSPQHWTIPQCERRPKALTHGRACSKLYNSFLVFDARTMYEYHGVRGTLGAFRSVLSPCGNVFHRTGQSSVYHADFWNVQRSSNNRGISLRPIAVEPIDINWSSLLFRV